MLKSYVRPSSREMRAWPELHCGSTGIGFQTDDVFLIGERNGLHRQRRGPSVLVVEAAIADRCPMTLDRNRLPHTLTLVTTADRSDSLNLATP